MNKPPPHKLAEWRMRAAQKGAIVPEYFEVFTNKVVLLCGSCKHEFKRPLIPNIDEPTFACPNCKAKNWVPVRFDLKY